MTSKCLQCIAGRDFERTDEKYVGCSNGQASLGRLVDPECIRWLASSEEEGHGEQAFGPGNHHPLDSYFPAVPRPLVGDQIL